MQLCCTVIQRCQRKTLPIFKALFEHLFVAKISKEVGSTDTSISRLQQNEPTFLYFMCRTPYDLIRNKGSALPIVIYYNLR